MINCKALSRALAWSYKVRLRTNDSTCYQHPDSEAFQYYLDIVSFKRIQETEIERMRGQTNSAEKEKGREHMTEWKWY